LGSMHAWVELHACMTGLDLDGWMNKVADHFFLSFVR
jgi:hypothetical protein